MNKFNFDKLFIILPQVTSGGPELGHQLVDYLRSNGKNAYVAYLYKNRIIAHAEVMESYRKYNVAVADSIEDSSDNVLVLPETLFEYARKYTKIRIACWWMSVDKFIGADLKRNPLKWYEDKSLFQNIRKNIHVALWHLPCAKFDILGYLRTQSFRVIHLYQSEYARQYLVANSMKNCFPLSDYINEELIPTYTIDHSMKENVILYNPAKGYEFTKLIIDALPEYEFVALRGFNRNQLNTQFDRAKLYIDFGTFPGKDRLPRECALHDCCIITGKNGASAYYEDVPIAENYKFDTYQSDIMPIVNQIQDVMNHFDERILDFAHYKVVIKGEEERFHQEVKSIFM